MSDTMRAARAYSGEERFRLEDVPVPTLAADEVLLRVASSGLNRGLLSLWRMHPGFLPLLPMTLGFEGAGSVAAVGGDVSAVSVGDRVLLHAALSCRVCRWCRSDADPDCPHAANIGHAVYEPGGMALYERYHDGTMAEFVRAPWWALEPLPSNVPFEVGARLPSIGVARHSIARTGVGLGDTLVVNAATGAYGAAALLVARLFGIRRVVAVGRRREPLERSVALDPAHVVPLALEELGSSWTPQDLAAAIVEANDGERVDGVVDLVPFGAEAAQGAILAMRKGGTAVLTGGNAATVELGYLPLMQNAWVVRGSRGPRRSDTRALVKAVAAGDLDVAPAITHRFLLADANAAADAIWDRVGEPWFVAIDVDTQ